MAPATTATRNSTRQTRGTTASATTGGAPSRKRKADDSNEEQAATKRSTAVTTQSGATSTSNLKAVKPAPSKTPKQVASRAKKPAASEAIKAASRQWSASSSPQREVEDDDGAPVKRKRNEAPAQSKKPSLSTTAIQAKEAFNAKKEAEKKKAATEARKIIAAKKAEQAKKAVAAKIAVAEAKQAATEAKKIEQIRKLPEINSVPSQKVDVFVMGQGENGELGLGAGPTKTTMGVKRPRLHGILSSGNFDVVHLALGGMHAAALTMNNEILTWGVNDDSACGRDTSWDGGLRDVDDDSDSSSSSEDEENGLNPYEATPTPIPSEKFPEGTKFVQLAAGDSCTFALTSQGLVYGWGTFRDNNGVLGFRTDVHTAKSPMLIPELKNIREIACGNNFALALDTSGNVFVWGAGDQNQLGRRTVERTRNSGLRPRLLALPKRQTISVSTGGDHGFAITKNDKVYSWGLNNYGQTGIPDNAGEDTAIIPQPTVVKSLSDYKLTILKGGTHHSVAVSDKGVCLVWGRADGGQLGLDTSLLPKEDVIMQRDKVAIVTKPAAIPDLKFKFATTASDHSIALTNAGKAYSWGFNGLHQTGLGAGEDVRTATLIDNTAIRNREVNWAGTGGQFSALTSLASSRPSAQVNGISATAPVPASSVSFPANAKLSNGLPERVNAAPMVNGVTANGSGTERLTNGI